MEIRWNWNPLPGCAHLDSLVRSFPGELDYQVCFFLYHVARWIGNDLNVTEKLLHTHVCV